MDGAFSPLGELLCSGNTLMWISHHLVLSDFRCGATKYQQNPVLNSFIWDVWHQLPLVIQSSLAFSNSSPVPPLVFHLQLLHPCRWLYPTVRALSRHTCLAGCRNYKLLFIYLLQKIPLENLASIC